MDNTRCEEIKKAAGNPTAIKLNFREYYRPLFGEPM